MSIRLWIKHFFDIKAALSSLLCDHSTRNPYIEKASSFVYSSTAFIAIDRIKKIALSNQICEESSTRV